MLDDDLEDLDSLPEKSGGGKKGKRKKKKVESKKRISVKKREVKRLPQIGRIAMWKFSFLFMKKCKDIF